MWVVRILRGFLCWMELDCCGLVVGLESSCRVELLLLLTGCIEGVWLYWERVGGLMLRELVMNGLFLLVFVHVFLVWVPGVIIELGFGLIGGYLLALIVVIVLGVRGLPNFFVVISV